MAGMIEQELNHRLKIWEELRATSDTGAASLDLIDRLAIRPRGSGRGIWYNKKRTGALDSGGPGITVSVLHRGTRYPDDLADDGIVYHYPETRSPGRDMAEIKTTKLASEHSLPVFVVVESGSEGLRRVELGWIVDWDDASNQFLILFGDSWPAYPGNPTTDAPFHLRERRTTRKSVSSISVRDPQFAFRVFRRYGPNCAFCDVDVRELLDAVHVCPKNQRGSDDPRNGLVLCALHHRAFDAGLLTIVPESAEIKHTRKEFGRSQLRTRRGDILHLRAQPHPDAVKWHWTWAMSKSGNMG